MTRGKAEDAGGLTPAKDDNAAPYHFDRRTLPIFKCVDYSIAQRPIVRKTRGTNHRGQDVESVKQSLQNGNRKSPAPIRRGAFFMAAGEGFEPSHTESESAVLPLHNPAVFITNSDYYTHLRRFVKGVF